MYTVQSTNVGLAATAMMVGAVTSDALLEKVFFSKAGRFKRVDQKKVSDFKCINYCN